MFKSNKIRHGVYRGYLECNTKTIFAIEILSGQQVAQIKRNLARSINSVIIM